jgi:hypothetical protein
VDAEAQLDWQTQAALLTVCQEIAEVWDGTVFLTYAPREPQWQDSLKANAAAFAGWAQVWAVEDGRTSLLVDPCDPFLRSPDPGGTHSHGTDGTPALALELETLAAGEGA